MGLFTRREKTPLETLYAKANKDQRLTAFALWNTLYAQVLGALQQDIDTVSIKVVNGKEIMAAMKAQQPIPGLQLNLELPDAKQPESTK